MYGGLPTPFRDFSGDFWNSRLQILPMYGGLPTLFRDCLTATSEIVNLESCRCTGSLLTLYRDYLWATSEIVAWNPAGVRLHLSTHAHSVQNRFLVNYR